MLGDLAAFAASILILGEVIAAGALGIAPFYVVSRPSWIRELIRLLNLRARIDEWFALITPAPDRDLMFMVIAPPQLRFALHNLFIRDPL
jgi:hypothetical protein